MHHHAERVALDVAEHDPRHLALADVQVARAQLPQTLRDLQLPRAAEQVQVEALRFRRPVRDGLEAQVEEAAARQDRKSTRLNSSHVAISYAVFCLKKKRHNKQV